jgi:hypothetical protein
MNAVNHPAKCGPKRIKVCTPKMDRISSFGAFSIGFAIKSSPGVLANGFLRS